MPLIEIERVLPEGGDAAPPGLAQSLADAAGRVLGSAPGHTWVRLRTLPASAYAENDAVALDAAVLPVFVTVLHAHPPQAEALAVQVRALTEALALALGVQAQRVHVQIAPPGAGRQAFGGTMVS
jgi:phenylpyruvate tautomerase PptA (4-oxalocrotonate tautomerase family)